MFALYFFLIFFTAWNSMCANGEDVVVQMFSKNPINYISDKYVSYSVDPIELLEMNEEKEDSFLYRMMESGPCYLKIYGNNTNKMRLDGDSIDLNSSKLSLEQLKNVYDVLRSADIKPVIALPYDSKKWNTRNVMRILGKVSLLDMDDIIWQLGADFHAKDAINYIDDLNTLKLIVGAFADKTNKKNWSVVGSDITLGSNENEARMYSEFSRYTVDAVGWSQSIDLNYSEENVDDFFSNMNIEPALRTILNGESPVWLSMQQKNIDWKNPLAHMKHGLNWAQTLGDAAKNGFKVIFTPINKQNWYEHSMSYYTTLLHKRIIGQIVFDAKIFGGNRFDTHFYSHCTKNMSGSFTVFGVNAADSSLDITAKLPFLSGTQYMEFILTVGVNGKVYLNGAEIVEPAVLMPEPKFKLPGKGAALSMPAHSVAFWVFTDASIPECASVETISFENDEPHQLTSSELLLQQLIVETVSNDENVDSTQDDESDENSIKRTKRHTTDDVNSIDKHTEYNAIEMNKPEDLEMQSRDKRFIDGKYLYNTIDNIKRRNFIAPYKTKLPTRRIKRDINMLKNLFDKYDMKKQSIFKTPSLKFGTKGLIPSITTVHDVFMNPGEQEKKIFAPVENPDFPVGDVHFELAEVPVQNQYAAPAVNQVPIQAPNQHYSHLNVLPTPTLNVYGNIAAPPPPVAAAPPANVPVVLGELSEVEDLVTVAPPPPATVQSLRPPQHHLQFVVKDLPPTWQVNLANMEKARNNLRQNLWPMNIVANPQTANAKIASYLPNVAHVHNVPAQEHVLFESKRRRRRSINSNMNEEIEQRIERIQRGAMKKPQIHLTNTMEQVNLLDKMLQMLDDLELSQNSIFKGAAGIKKQLNGEDDEVRSPKKCKILSMAMEKQCMQAEVQPKALFKRAIENRSKKPAGPLKKLFDKYDMKKQSIFKTPSLKFGTKGLIPSITTVHDVFMNPGEQEKKIFAPVENPDFPVGDVHFELAEVPVQNQYAVPAVNQVPIQAPNQHYSHLNVLPTPTLNVYGNIAAPPPPVAAAPPANVPVVLGELSEVEDLVTIAPPPPATVQSLRPPQHHLQFVVKDLPPTWQVNLANMEKARNNLRQNLWPMNIVANPQTANAKIASYLPNVAHVHNVPAQDHVLFESKRRRRRSINSNMNEEIEQRIERIQRGAMKKPQIHLTNTMEQVNLLDKMLQMLDDLELSQNSIFKGAAGIKKQLNGEDDEVRSPKKCKILSMAMEKQCMQAEVQPKALFKRAIENRSKKPAGPLKKLFAKIKDSADRRPLKIRTKRSIPYANSEENSITKQIAEDDELVGHKIVYNKRRFESKHHTTTSTTTTTPVPQTKPEERTESAKDSEKSMPKMMNKVKTYVNNVTNAVARQIGRFWVVFSR